MSGDAMCGNVMYGKIRLLKKEECTDTSYCGSRIKDRSKEDKRWRRGVEDVNDTT
jgi:hypothetical protein